MDLYQGERESKSKRKEEGKKDIYFPAILSLLTIEQVIDN